MIESQPASNLADKAYEWWWALQDVLKDGKTRNWKADRAALARLRRADPDDVFVDEAIISLYRKLFGETAAFDEKNMSLAIRVALVLAHARKDEKGDFAAALGEGGPNAKLKPLRFKRLLQVDQNSDMIREFRRAIHLLGNRVDVKNLARILVGWEYENTRTRFAFSYFGKSAASPTETLSV